MKFCGCITSITPTSASRVASFADALTTQRALREILLIVLCLGEAMKQMLLSNNYILASPLQV